MKLIGVHCLDDGKVYYFNAKNGFDAMEKMKEYLNLSHLDKFARIDLHFNRTLEMDHNGKVYACLV